MANAQDVYELLVTTTGVEDLKKAEEGLKKVGEAAQDTSKKMTGATAEMKTARQGVLDLSRAAQDFTQGGFAGIVNNLEGIGRGLTAMLANPIALFSSIPALMTMAGVAILTFGSKVAEVAAKIQDIWNPDRIKTIQSDTERLKATIKEIGDKPVKLAVDTAELENAEKKLKALQKAQAEWDARQGKQGEHEAEAGKVTQELLEGADLGKIQQDIKTNLIKQFTEQSKQGGALGFAEGEIDAAMKGYARDQLTGVRVFVGKAAANNYLEMMREQAMQEKGRIAASAQTQTSEMITGTIEGKGAVGAMRRKQLVEHLQATGRGDLAAAVAGTTPEGLEAGDKETKEFQARMDRAKMAGEMRRSKAAVEKKQQTDAAKAEEVKVKEAEKLAADAEAEAKKAGTAQQRAEQVRQQLAREANKPFLEREAHVIKVGGFAEQAEAMLAAGRFQGGFGGRRMTPDQQFAFVQAQAAQQLKQRFPGMGGQQRGDVATRIAAMGQKGLQQRMVDLAAQGVNVNQRTEAAMQGALGAVQQLANKMNQQGARADQMARGFGQVNNFAQGMPGVEGGLMNGNR